MLSNLNSGFLQQAAAQAAQSGGGGAGAGGAGLGAGGLGGAAGAGGIDPAEIQQLRNSPAFQQLRQLVAQNPAFIQPLIQQLAESNPAIAQQMVQNPELIFQLLGGEPGAEGGDLGALGGLGAEGAEGEGQLPPGAIQVTEEEHAAIQRVSQIPSRL